MIAILGAGGHGQTVRDCIYSGGTASAAKFFDDQTDTPISKLFGDPAFRAWHVIVAIGANVHRRRLCEQVIQRGGTLWTVQHCYSFVSQAAELGEGSSIHFGAHVGADVTIGKGCIVNNLASVGHGGKLGDYVNLCDGAVLGGNVVVGDDAFIGLNATLLPGITIGAGAKVGAGAVVVGDVPPGATVFGNPARVFK